MTDPMTDDWAEYDALNVLALPLHRLGMQPHYGIGATADMVYSNGTEHGFAVEAAENLLDLGPMLRKVLLAGVRALEKDERLEAYTLALASGDRDEIVRLEREEAES